MLMGARKTGSLEVGVQIPVGPPGVCESKGHRFDPGILHQEMRMGWSWVSFTAGMGAGIMLSPFLCRGVSKIIDVVFRKFFKM